MNIVNVNSNFIISGQTTELIFFVNGKKVIESEPQPEWTLLDYLRKKIKLCGTKLGCGEGGCGACTVMISKYNRTENNLVHLAVNACLAPLCSMHGLAVTTVEGIGSMNTKLHPVQERIAKSHGSQCGFCTPGIVMSMYSLLRNSKNIKYKDIETAFQGNLCRCTGYRPILEGFKTLLESYENGYIANGTNGQDFQGCAMGKACCKNKLVNGESCSVENTSPIFDCSSFKPYDPSQEPIFPPELKISSMYDNQYLIFKSTNITWLRPNTLKQVLCIKRIHPDCKIVVGNTEIGIEMRLKQMIYPVIMSPVSIREMNTVRETELGLIIGASITLTDIETCLQHQISKRRSHETRIFKSIIEMLHLFAGKQIRNVASVGGNIMTGSPISDLNPIFMAAGVILNVCSEKYGEREVKLDETFFTGYRINNLKPEEVLISLQIPYTKKYQYFRSYKQSKRREDDISIVTSAFNVELEINSNTVKNVCLAFGGMAATTQLAVKTGLALKKRKWDESILDVAFDNLLSELPLSFSAPGGVVPYRRSLTMSLFFKFYLSVAEEIEKDYLIHNILTEFAIGKGENLASEIPKSSQYFQLIGDEQIYSDAVGRPVLHTSSIKQATGEAVYCDDIPSIAGELYLALVLSSKAYANILSIDATEALSISGVEAFFSAADLSREKNVIGPIDLDEEIFVSKTVYCEGRPIGAIVAIDQATAQKAASKVNVVYEELSPIIVTLEDAIQKKSFYPGYPRTLSKGDVSAAFESAPHVVEGKCRSGAQEHFYLETHAALAVPREDEMEIFCSTQQPFETARVIAKTLGLPINRVVCRVKRLGGGFGGKEWRSMLVSLPVSLAAHRLRRPVRCSLDRQQDMRMTGNRHPYYSHYRVAFNQHGKILGADIQLYANAGCSMDVSCAVNERATFHVENSYHIPNIKIAGYLCKSNLPSNTAFRGFGAPQAMLVGERMIRDVAHQLGCSSEEVARTNLYCEGDYTPNNQLLTHCTLQRCWNQCIQKSNFDMRRNQIEEFNRKNRWQKRGISIVPTKYGVSFGTNVLMQAGSLVHIYVDGSVLISHGGIEMGQGLHTKMIQVASRALQVDMSKIHISETSIDKVPNTSQTAASVSSDLNGMAVMRACTSLAKRLEPYKRKNPNGSWEDWVSKAYIERVNLSATGFYRSPEVTYNFDTNTGHLYDYFTYGVACSEVIVDCLTGDHRVLRTDIVMDLGDSLNPAIDIGQIEGAFMQGYGLFMMEELIYSPKGTLYSTGPGAYKIPGFGDIPRAFNVSLLKGAPNPRAVYSSKAVGEPPLFLASSVLFAVEEAVSAARRDSGAPAFVRLDCPATPARVRMACEDNITRRVPKETCEDYVPWNVAP